MTHKIFSGVKPTGTLHLGNYAGAVRSWLELQENNRCIFCVVDLHAITVAQDPLILQRQTLQMAAMYLALGLDPKKSILFVQSDVKEHTELGWILNCLTKISELKLMHQFKEKSLQNKENINAGLFDYPVLMAADILLYGTTLVPIGDDQKQHLELARELARRFNAQYGDTFIVPDGYIPDAGTSARIMGLDNPHKKMSKSAVTANNYIELTDTAQVVRDKISRAVTDSGKEIKMHHDKPAVSNLLTIYSVVSGKSIDVIEAQYDGASYKEFKEGLADAIIEFLQPIQERYNDWLQRDDELRDILSAGADQARTIAVNTMNDVKKRVGLGL